MHDDMYLAHLIHTRRVAAILTEMGSLLRSPVIQDPEGVLAVLALVETDLARCREILRPPPPTRDRWTVDDDPNTLPF